MIGVNLSTIFFLDRHVGKDYGKKAQPLAETAELDEAPRMTTRSAQVELRFFAACYAGSASAVVGSIPTRTSAMRFAGKPLHRACSRMMSASGAMYTQ